MDPVSILVAVLILLVVLWIVHRFIPLSGDLKQLLIVIIIVIFVLYMVGVI